MCFWLLVVTYKPVALGGGILGDLSGVQAVDVLALTSIGGSALLGVPSFTSVFSFSALGVSDALFFFGEGSCNDNINFNYKQGLQA